MSKPFKIYQTSLITFSFWERLKILLGRRTIVNGTIYVNKEVIISKATVTAEVLPFMKPKRVVLSDTPKK
jgi:hypothetical protein